jgi:hypothetical protein
MDHQESDQHNHKRGQSIDAALQEPVDPKLLSINHA